MSEQTDEELKQKRKDAAARTAKSRALKKEREEKEKEDEGFRYAVRQQLVGRGTVRAGCPASGSRGANNDQCPLKSCPHLANNADEWLFCARRWAVAAGCPDIQLGESIHGFEKRVYSRTTSKVKVAGRAPVIWESAYLSLRTGKYDDEWFATFDFDPNDSPNDIPALARLMTKEDLEELPEVKGTTHVDTYMKALDENRKRIAFEARIAREEAEGSVAQREREANRLLESPFPAVHLRMQGDE
jgi:hypothetical protein